jgi:hypothetical protein
MTIDVTTLALAVDSTQVNTASTALDRMTAAGSRAEGAASKLKPAVEAQGRALAASGQAASKTALSFRTLEEAQAALGPQAAAALAKVAGDLGATKAKADAAGQSLRKMGDDAQAAGNKASAALTAASAAPVAAAGGAGGRIPGPPQPPLQFAPIPVAPQPSSQQPGAAAASATEVQKTAGAATAAAAGIDRLREAEQALALADARVAASQAALTSAVARNAQAQQQLATANASSASSQAQVAQATARAASANAAVLSAQASLTANQQAAAKAAATHQVALAGLGKQASRTAYEQQQLGFQLHDFAVQVFSGQSPLTAFVQQGSQLAGTFGGAGNAFRAVLSMLTPMRVAMGAAAAAVGVLGLAMAQAESAARDLAQAQTQLAATGREDLFSDKELKQFINQLAQVRGISHDAAVGIVQEFSKFKDIGPEIFKDLAGSVADYAAATGKSLPEAAKALATAFADPVRGVKLLDDVLTKMTGDELLAIQRLAQAGDTAGAARVMFEALERSINGAAARGMTPLQTATEDLTKAWRRATNELGQSESLRALNDLLAGTVGLVKDLVDLLPKLGGLRTVLPASIAAAGPASLGEAITGPLRRAIFGPDGADPTAVPTGNFARQDRAASAGTPVGAKSRNAAQADITETLKATEGFRSQAQEIAKLKGERDRLNKSLEQSIALDKQDGTLKGKPSETTKELRGRIAGVNERIAAAGKKGAGGNEPQQVLDAQLEQRVKAAQEALQKERDQLAFSQRFLQGVYQAGEISLRDFFEQKRQAIQQGTEAEIAELEKERAAVQAHLDATKKTSPKDTSALVKDQTRLQEIDAKEAKLRDDAARESVLATQEESAAVKQLNEQIDSYRANLRQLAGDEAGAARIRNQLADRLDAELAKRAAKEGKPISPEELAAVKKGRDDQVVLNDAKLQTSLINQRLQIEEERIGLAQSTGAVGEIEALTRQGAARAQVVALLEQQLAAMEKISQENPGNLQLKVDVEGFRLQVDKLKASLDPLEERFRGIFKDAGSGLFSDLMNGTKPRDIARNLANAISRPINDMVGRTLSESLFAKGGSLGSVSGFFADLFGGKNRNAASDAKNTAQEAFRQSEIAAQNAAGKADVTAANVSQANAAVSSATALTDLAAAAQAAAVSLRTVTGTPLPPLPGTTGDFARLDRGQRVGEPTVPDALADTSRSSERLSDANVQAASSVVQLASAAARGGNAMSLLPSVVQSIITATSAAGASSSGGGLLGSLASLFGSSSSAAPSFVDLGTASGADLALFFHSGGIVGQDRDMRPVAPGVFAGAAKYHTGGIVGPAARQPDLAAHEVPAILMGGPKGTREEVLHADDPRHSDRLTPELRKIIFERRMPAEKKAAPSIQEAPAAGGARAVVLSQQAERPEAVAPNVAGGRSRAAVTVLPQPASRQDAGRGYVESVVHRTMGSDAPGYRAGGLIDRSHTAERSVTSLSHLVTTPMQAASAAPDLAVQVPAPRIAFSDAPAAGIPPAHVIAGPQQLLRESHDRSASSIRDSRRTERSSVERIRETVLGGGHARGERVAAPNFLHQSITAAPEAGAGVVVLSSGGAPATAGQAPADIVHILSAAAADSIGKASMERLHAGAGAGDRETSTPTLQISGRRELGGPVSAGGLYRINERGPEVLQMGGAQYLMTGSKDGEVTPVGGTSGGGSTVVHVNVTPPPGGSRETAMQWGATAGRQIQNSLRRNGK